MKRKTTMLETAMLVFGTVVFGGGLLVWGLKMPKRRRGMAGGR